MANEYLRKEIKGNVPKRTLSAGINASDTTITLSSGTSWPTGDPGPFVIALERGHAAEEKVLISSRVGAVLTVHASGRGYDGTTAGSHASGVDVEHVLDAATIDQANRLANLFGTDVGGMIASNGVNPVLIGHPTAANYILLSDLGESTGWKIVKIPDVVSDPNAPSATTTVYNLWFDETLGTLRISDGATTWQFQTIALPFASAAARTSALGGSPANGLFSIVGGILAVSIGNAWVDIARRKDSYPRFANTTARDAYYTSPGDGDGCYLTGTHVRQSYRNGAWIDTDHKVTVSASAPTGGQAGDIWLEPLT